VSGWARKHRVQNIAGQTDKEREEGSDHQQNETGKYKDVKDPRPGISRMLPLSEPELRDSGQAGPGMIETAVAFGSDEGHEPARDDVGETSDACQVQHDQ
jgi:hypothetical protein